MRIRDLRKKIFGSGMKKVRIRDKHSGSGINIPDPQRCIKEAKEEIPFDPKKFEF
jgi:hypothetical protein